MIKCPHCGYERKKGDEIIREAECPRCGIIYNKWKPAEDQGNKVLSIKPTEPVSPNQSLDNKKNIERKIIFALGIVALIVLANSFFIPQLIKYFKQEKNETSNPQLPQIYNERENRQGSTQVYNLPTGTQAPAERKPEMSLTEVIRITKQSVVVVKTPSGMGSGFFINSQGYIVTNRHVLSNANGAQIKTAGGNVYSINKIVAEDSDGDLVIASSDAPSSESAPLILNANPPEVGEKVVIIGSPLGYEQTVSEGIVSAVRNDERAVKFIQTTAAVSPGNSGGPLLNMRGEAIGVVALRAVYGQNLNFCIAAERVTGLQGGTVSQSSQSSGQSDVYCYVDSQGDVHFVDWQTGILISRPDGTLDRDKFIKYALDQVGGDPNNINPEKEAQAELDYNRERLFKEIFPKKSMNESLNAREKEILERKYYNYHVDMYNKAMNRRNEAVRKLNMMMRQFDKIYQDRRFVKKKFS